MTVQQVRIKIQRLNIRIYILTLMWLSLMCDIRLWTSRSYQLHNCMCGCSCQLHNCKYGLAVKFYCALVSRLHRKRKRTNQHWLSGDDWLTKITWHSQKQLVSKWSMRSGGISQLEAGCDIEWRMGYTLHHDCSLTLYSRPIKNPLPFSLLVFLPRIWIELRSSVL